jgi:hypothetical protein
MPAIKYVNTVVQVRRIVPHKNKVTNVLQYLMASVVVACFLFSMGNKPHAYVFFPRTAGS